MPIRRGDSLREDFVAVPSTQALVHVPEPPVQPTKVVPKITVNTPWKRYKLFNSPFPRYRHAASSITSEKNEIFLMGGLKEGSVFGDTWKILPEESPSGEVVGYSAKNIDIANLNNPPARVGHSAVLCGNAFIIYGGDTVDTDFNGFPDNNFYLFNINNSKYTIPGHILNKPNGRYGHTVGVISVNDKSSRLYLFGGQLENDVFSDLYYFELNTFKSPKARWELVEPLNNFKPPPLTNHSMSVYKTKIYVFGGVYNNERVSNDLWSYDALVNKWTQIPTSGAVPQPVNEHSACVVNDKLYIYGGNDFSGIIYNTLYVLDLHTFVWSKLSDGELDGPGPRCGHSMTYLPKFDKFVIMGGDKNDYINDDPNNFETYEEYNGEEIGTMIYELDLSVLDQFVTNEVAEPVVKQAPPKKIAASAAPAKPDGPSSALRQSYERHARSFSAGPEDFRTPEPSPSRALALRDDKFVNVPETTENSYTAASLDPHADQNLDSYNNGDVHVEDYQTETYASPTREPTIKETSSVSRQPTVSRDQGTRGIVSEDTAVTRDAYNNGHSEDVKKIIAELNNELNELKASTKQQMQNATERINTLEQENKSLKDSHSNDSGSYEKRLQEKDLLINELRGALDPNALVIDPAAESSARSGPGSLSELSKYKLDRLELSNKLLYLEQENTRLNERLVRFEPFMNNQIGGLTKFQKIIKVQEEKIHKLSQQVKDEMVLHKEINEWKAKHENLELEFENYKSIYYDEPVSDEEDEPEIDDPQNNRSILSSATRRSKKDISSHLENLVTLWNVKTTESTRDVASEHELPANNQFVGKLQNQIDDLLRIGKQNEAKSQEEIARLKSDLGEKLNSLKTFEENYRDAIQSVNNTSKALKMNEDEIRNQRVLIEKLTKENNELNLFKKASKRHSSRQPTPLAQGQHIRDSSIPEEDDQDHDIDEASAINHAHFNMKIQDLEADLYILKQERDQLKDNVTSLQKQLYFQSNN
ncbi:uncharacterized protein CANTADRAFT_57681 [Suhomyces tanzawaensis NRRL Y-17324]|uniref:Galactose oxidase n=1 Tax=Suhomyces tanzawaensis NRRL Y-17324 TaxID=984487 RepID=A0A1E4SBI4_9ASCO|nr:uncharacterized protein CANTADRAFT_57681 [Suhomyces tanzawaensis NRRL Y-17324]ODV76826.1 hypothetical protein CANTADRAFT_57681 [Suhomyces tanzawaensis NRRL Y-17324]